jgi:hypothetical protein
MTRAQPAPQQPAGHRTRHSGHDPEMSGHDHRNAHKARVRLCKQRSDGFSGEVRQYLARQQRPNTLGRVRVQRHLRTEHADDQRVARLTLSEEQLRRLHVVMLPRGTNFSLGLSAGAAQ